MSFASPAFATGDGSCRPVVGHDRTEVAFKGVGGSTVEPHEREPRDGKHSDAEGVRNTLPAGLTFVPANVAVSAPPG